MFRRLTVAVVMSLAAIGLAIPGTASADPDAYCTSTSPISLPDIFVDGTGHVHFLGTRVLSYVGSTPALLTDTYRVWHVTYDPAGAPPPGYVGAFAAKCSSSGSELSEVDLTKDPPPLSPFDQRCGTTDFMIGFTGYHYVGARSSSGDTFRYWGTTTSTPLFFGRSVTAARCD